MAQENQSNAAAAKAAAETRKQNPEVVEEPAAPTPYPSQEEADAIKSAAASGAAPYKTRDLKA